jgi:peptide/nickel transport system substrate-binding protein
MIYLNQLDKALAGIYKQLQQTKSHWGVLMKRLGKTAMTTVALATSMSMLLAGCGGAQSGANQTGTDTQPKDGGTLTIGQHLPFDNEFIPNISSLLYTYNITNAAFDPLLSVNKQLKYIPWLAKSWTWSNDKKTVTIELQDKANWSDGKPITSDDVLLALDFLGSKDYNTTLQGQNGYLVASILGSDKLLNGKATSFAQTGGFHKINDKMFSITFNQADAAVLFSQIAAIQPLPAHVLKSIPFSQWGSSSFDKMPTVVSGPFMFSAVHGKDSVEMKANPSYWKGKPHIATLIFKTVSSDVAPGLLANGNVDFQLTGMKAKDIDNLRNLNNVNVYTEPDMGYYYVGMKLYKPEFKDVRVRQAFMYGIDRAGIVKGVLKGYGQVLNGPLPSVSWAAATTADGMNPYNYDVAKANQLLDQAGWKIGSDGWRIDPYTHQTANLHVVHPTDSDRTQVALAVQQGLAKLHIKVTVDAPLDVSTMYSKVQSDDKSIDMWVGGWSLSADPDPRGLWGSKDTSNYERWVDPKNDQLIADTYGIKAFDPNYRKQALVKWQLYVNQQVPLLFMYQKQLIWPVNKRVHIPQSDLTSVGPINLQDWWVD